MGDRGYEPSTAPPELEGSGYQSAPITALALARWSWAVAGLLVGGVLGWAAVATGGGYSGTAVVQIRSTSSDAGGTSGDNSSAVAALASSDAVLTLAVAALRDEKTWAPLYRRYGGRLPAAAGPAKDDETAARNYLGGAVSTATPTGSTSVVRITVTGTGSRRRFR